MAFVNQAPVAVAKSEEEVKSFISERKTFKYDGPATLQLQGLDDAGLGFLLECLTSSNNNTLKGLRVRGRLGDRGAGLLAVFLTHNHSLQEVNLWKNKIGDEGARALANVLRSNSTLTLLNLRENEVGDEGAKVVVEAILNNPNSKLERVYLNGKQTVVLLRFGLCGAPPLRCRSLLPLSREQEPDLEWGESDPGSSSTVLQLNSQNGRIVFHLQFLLR